MTKSVTIGTKYPLKYTGYDRLKDILKNDIYGEFTNISFIRKVKYEGQKLKLGIFARLSPQTAKKKNKKIELINTYDPRRDYIIGFYPEKILGFIEKTGKGIDAVAYTIAEPIDHKEMGHTLHLYNKSDIKGSWMNKKYMEYLEKLATHPITKVEDILNDEGDKIHTFRVYQNVINLDNFDFGKMYTRMTRESFKTLFGYLTKDTELDVDKLTAYLYSYISKPPLVFTQCNVYGKDTSEYIRMELISPITKIVVQYGNMGGYSLQLNQVKLVGDHKQKGRSFIEQIDELLDSGIKRGDNQLFPKIRTTALQDIFYHLKHHTKLKIAVDDFYYESLDFHADSIEHVQNIVNAIYKI